MGKHKTESIPGLLRLLVLLHQYFYLRNPPLYSFCSIIISSLSLQLHLPSGNFLILFVTYQSNLQPS
jgi:hypothetical protein